MDTTVNVPIDNPNADTEWNDILRKHGIIPEKPLDPEPIIQEALIEARIKAHENRLEDKDLDELNELEDDEDEAFLEKYKKQRLNELSNLQQQSIHGQVYPLRKAEYTRDVTDASLRTYVLVNMTSSSGANPESRVLTDLWRQLALKFGDLKFCEIRANLCVEGYPERNTPTILIYKDGDVKRQVITLRELNGPKTTAADIEKLLISIGAIKENDSRLRTTSDDDDSRQNGINEEEDDGDWD